MASAAPARPVHASALPPALWIGVGLAAFCFAAFAVFRTPFAAGLEIAAAANGARALAAAGVGAALGAFGVLDAPRAAPLREVKLASGLLGGCAGLAVLLFQRPDATPVLAAAAVVAGAALGFGGAWLAGERRPAGNLWLASWLTLLLLSAAFVFGMASARAEGLGGWLLWALGDLSHAALPGAAAIAALALAAVVLAIGSGRLRIPHTALWWFAFGVAGPVPFVPWLVARVAPGPWSGAVLGAGAVAAADAVPRLLIGGYAPPMNLVIAVAATPWWLWWNRRRLHAAAARPPGRMFSALEAIVLLGGTALAVGLAVAIVNFVDLAT